MNIKPFKLEAYNANMRIVDNLIHLDRKELSDLIRKGIIEGPIIKQKIAKKDYVMGLGSSIERVYKEAVRTAAKNDCQVIHSFNSQWLAGKGAEIEYEFYKFKFS